MKRKHLSPLPPFRISRFPENPLIHSRLHPEIGNNINGPAVVRVPDWVKNPLGKFYLYFAHHRGAFIRMAYAEKVNGPWTIHPGGVLNVAQTPCQDHIASPDVLMLKDEMRIRLYFHGVTKSGQRTFLAESTDGLHFEAYPDALGPFYFRVFPHAGAWYALAKRTDAPGGGILLRSENGRSRFEQGPHILPDLRHAAVWKRNDRVWIFFSRGTDCPERILVSEMLLHGDWHSWAPGEIAEVMRPETDTEGAFLPQTPARFGAAHHPVHELRDPAVLLDNDQCFLFYTGAGESNICGCRISPRGSSATAGTNFLTKPPFKPEQRV